MFVEITTSIIAGGLVGYCSYQKAGGANDAAKIQRIFTNCGLIVKENGQQRTMQLIRRTRHVWGMEYAYRIPLGLSFSDFEKKSDHIKDGLNNKRNFIDLSLNDLKGIKLNSSILRQIKGLLQNKMKSRKEVEMSYDGLLKIRVYNEGLTELLSFDESTFSECKGWGVPIGVTRSDFVTHDFDLIPHLVVAGTTRYGKSVFLKNIITTLIHRQPTHVKFTLIDLKGGLTFSRFKNLSQVQTVAKNAKETLEALREIQSNVNKQMERFLKDGYENVSEAGLKERHFIVIDEGAELASKGEVDSSLKATKQECESIISEIARVAGGLGYRLVFATQYPTSDTLPRQVKQNCDAKLCFKLQTEIASQVVLGEGDTDAARLPLIKGRAIYSTDRKRNVQTPFIENDFIERTIKPHIVIKASQERVESSGEASQKGTEGRKHTLVIEEA